MYRHKLPLRVRLAGVACAAPNEAAPPPAPTPAPQEPPDWQTGRQMLAALSGFIDELKSRKQQVAGDIAQMTVELGVTLAERLLKSEIDANRQRLDRIVLHALERVSSANIVTLRAHSDDIAVLERQLSENTDLERYRGILTFQRDDTLERGQLKFEADEWFVEWDTPRCLAELRGALLEETG